jgi:hypothetical protein
MAKKNQKYRKRKQKKQFPWALAALGGVLVIAAAFFFFSQGQANSGGTPSIAVDQQKIDFGYIKLGEYRNFKIKVTNNGTGTLQFKETPYIEVLQGCCQPDLTINTMALKPGSSAYVSSPDFMMHEGMDGPHDFAVHLKTNDPQNPDMIVHVLSDWGP